MTVGHFIDAKSEQSSMINVAELSNILAPSVWFWIEYMTLFVASLAFVYLLAGQLGRRGTRKRAAFALEFAWDLFAQTNPIFRQASAIGLFSTFSLLFLFLVAQMLSNCVKTSKVIVSTEPLLDSLEKIARTNKGAISNTQILKL